MHPVRMWSLIGAILLIVGTSIGGGMLALPLATANMGFIPASVGLLMTWLLMTLGALYLLEVNVALPVGANLISMAGRTLGRFGQGLAWLSYLILLYSLLSAYTGGGRELVGHVLGFFGVVVSPVTATIVFVALFSTVVYCGLQKVDWLNRVIMIIKFSAYFALVAFSLPHLDVSRLLMVPTAVTLSIPTVMIMITAYGYAIIIPSLRTYFGERVDLLRRVVIVGSIIPLIFYVLWEGVIFAAVPLFGPNSLQTLAGSSQPLTGLMQLIARVSGQSSFAMIADIFTTICVLTAFLGVSLCLMDFLSDGLSAQKSGLAGGLIYLLTFVPPLLSALFAPEVFVYGLSLSGMMCVILLMLLPAWMAWRRRSLQIPSPYEVAGGRLPIIILILCAFVLMIFLLKKLFV